MSTRYLKAFAPTIVLVTIVSAHASLIGLWQFDETVGTNANNSVGASPNGTLNPGANFVIDAGRGRVVDLDGGNGFVDLGATTIPMMTLANDFTWAYWGRNDQSANSNVVLGNRFKPAGGDFSPREFIKFTNSQFEFHRNGGGENINYADVNQGNWIHHAVVKDGNELTYYRDGTAAGTRTITQGLNNPQPLYVGGDKTAENWGGRVDDVALFDEALTATQIATIRNQDFSAFGGPAITTGINAPVQSNAQSTTGFAVASDDLIEGLVATVVGNVSPAESVTTSDVGALTNGQFGTPSVSIANANEVVAIRNNTTLTYLLDLSGAPDGFNIDAIETYTGWRDGGRDAQAYSVQVAFADDLNTFFGVTTAAFNPPATNPSDTMVSLIGFGGDPIATNVGAIRFVFDTTENGFVGYRELDVFGSASAPSVTVPEPATTALTLLALTGMIRRPRRRA